MIVSKAKPSFLIDGNLTHCQYYSNINITL